MDDNDTIEMMDGGMMGLDLDDLFGDLPDDKDEFVKEEDTPDGTHVKKEIYTEGGVKRVKITKEGGPGALMPPGLMGGPPPGLMQMIMQDMMSGGMPAGGGTIRISSGGPGGMHMSQTITKRKIVPADHDDDEDEDGIPQEILDMMRMTEMMHGMPGPMSLFGGPRIKKEEKIDREDEKPEDIMARMNKLSQDIGEKSH